MRRPALALLLLLAGSGAAAAQGIPRWHSEPRPPNPSYDRPRFQTYYPLYSHAPRWNGQRWPAYRPGERGRYEASTVATYPLREAAPGNDCAIGAFEVLNARRGETRCAAVDHGW
ncbi:hypothetical protein [Salinarimonas soli]|uniref:Uncharacterized protein n=1 Tax=Salinarimonas soli TaxID=1638099 RepID=A0A5B2VGK7_9HYPH|nr:hypothetical protein [Salinarimonas soli]KAA2238024.1 hypothetical protein F0L46_07060 [Salinarimonas soli]